MAIKTANTTINNGTRIDDNTNSFWDQLTYSGKTALYGTQAQGFNYGYTSSGETFTAPATSTLRNVIDRFPFAASTTDATDVGDSTASLVGIASTSSLTHGYNAGGYPGYSNIIDRWPFAASTTNATDVGDLTVGRELWGGQSSDSYGYASGGAIPTAPGFSNTIDRWPFAASTTNAADVGDTIDPTSDSCGQSSDSYGYASGGQSPPATWVGMFERFPFASSTTNTTDVGDATTFATRKGGCSSADYGYNMGGQYTPGSHNVIDRWPFAALTTNAADVGDLLAINRRPAGISSTEYGYASGGYTSPTTYNVIQRFPYAASTTNTTDVGNLTIARWGAGGNQY